MSVKIAQTLDDFDFTLLKEPLNEENYDDYYVVTEQDNGEQWFDVHPVVKELLKDKQKIQ